MTRHCYNCGWEWKLSGQPGRNDRCHSCGNDLKVCLNCAQYDLKAAHQCRERRAEPVEKKEDANFCEYFEFVFREPTSACRESRREVEARDEFRKLFGD
ncbi:MAG: hypothetical protein K9N48_01200 [Verrucomicrobia bacterium]|nr:hypothetical protein [Verrucomicrobiota bacterium]MCF7707676.1 hypothetical protein [Verrucomicrobiota bacterium]